jgi:quinol-cytochrome oxidoreductase complex cytochrome b subunit
MKGKATMDLEKLKQASGLSALYYKVPQHANTIWYSFGGITLFCFLVAMGTGIIMAQFYSPSPATAYASVKYISSTAGLQLIRGIHHWSANLGFLMLIIHMLRIIITGAFRPPRIITYFVGLGLLLIIFLIYFTGTMLRGDQESYEAMRHFLAVNKLFGPIGAFFQEDFTLSTSMLSRIFAMHTSGLQIIFIIKPALKAAQPSWDMQSFSESCLPACLSSYSDWPSLSNPNFCIPLNPEWK